MSKFSVSHWGKKTDPNWKLIADLMLYSLPLFNGVILTMPVPDNMQKWALVVVNLAIVVFKAVSKFTKDTVDYAETSDKE